MEIKKAARDQIADHHGMTYLCDVFGGVIASFWKRGSFRSGSNIGSSWSSAGVSGIGVIALSLQPTFENADRPARDPIPIDILDR